MALLLFVVYDQFNQSNQTFCWNIILTKLAGTMAFILTYPCWKINMEFLQQCSKNKVPTELVSSMVFQQSSDRTLFYQT